MLQLFILIKLIMASEFLFEKAFDRLEFLRLCAIEDNYTGKV